MSSPESILARARLYAFVDTAYLHGRDPVRLAAQLCEGGADLIQLRAKTWSEAEALALARRILPITQAAGAGLVLNDFLAAAQSSGADFCHLGQEDFFDANHRHVSDLGALSCRIGLSTHSPAQAERALEAEPAYIAIGPVFATPTKPQAEPVTLEYVRWAAAHVDLPWFAIGGINLENLDQVLEGGARRVCVVSAILNSSDIVKTCSEFKRRVQACPLI